MSDYVNKYRAEWASPNNNQGYLYIDQLDYAAPVASILATPPTDAELLTNKTFTQYGRDGAKVYKLDSGSYIVDTSVSPLITPIVWKNTEGLTDGPMNRCGVWSVLDATSGQFIGFGKSINTLTAKLYWISVGCDNGCEVSVDNTVIFSLPTDDTLEDHYLIWHLLPVSLTAGTHLIRVRGYNDSELASIGAEIYDASIAELQAMTTVGQLEAKTIFSTKDFIGLYVQEGNFGTGWTCPEGWTLLNIDEVYSCERAIVEDFKLTADSMVISYAFEDWINPIMGVQCEFEIVNDKADFYELLPLLTAEEREYKIRVVVEYPTTYTLFEGFLNSDTVTQKYLHRQTIKFAASGYLLKLEGLHPISIDTLQNKTFIDVIDEILRSTGAEYNIRVNSQLRAEGDTLGTGQTLFNKNGFYTELFWVDEVERTNSLDILKAILTSFDCYIYWWKGYWYIERYEDIWSETVDFVEYVTGLSYLPDDSDAVVTVEQAITDVHDLKFINQSQTLSVISGLKTIKISLEDKRVNNLVLSSLKDASITAVEVPEPAYRLFLVWEEVNMTWEDYGLPKSNIVNSIRRQVTVPKPSYRGLYTTFKVTIDKDDIAVNIKFKYCIDMAATITGWTKKWTDYSFDFYWYLRIANTNFYIIQSGEDWVTSLGLSTGVIDNPTNVQENQMQVVHIDGSSFDANTKTVEVSVSIPLGLVKTYFGTSGNSNFTGLLIGEQAFVFGLGLERLTVPDGDTNGGQVDDCWIGDINITTTGGLQNNVIEANVLTAKFLNVKEITMSLYDMESYNYKNGILRGDTLLIRTERWGTTGGDTNIKKKGICWGVSANPTVADSRTDNGTGTDAFSSLMTGLIPNTTYYVRAYIETELGVIYGDDKTFTTANLQIGAHYQGGIIFYFLQPDDEGYDADYNKGLIASLVDQSTGSFWTRFDGNQPYQSAGVAAEIGFGLANSGLMDDSPFITAYAIAKCIDYVGDGFDDWYMPSIRELMEMRKQKAVIGGFAATWYWSSTEGWSYNYEGFSRPDSMGNLPEVPQSWKKAWAVNFKNSNAIDEAYFLVEGTQYSADTIVDDWDKNNNMRIRAIRSFTGT